MNQKTAANLINGTSNASLQIAEMRDQLIQWVPSPNQAPEAKKKGRYIIEPGFEEVARLLEEAQIKLERVNHMIHDLTQAASES